MRSPRVALAAILTLGVGIGATTAITSVVDAILFRPLPFRDGEQLVSLVQRVPPRQPDGETRERGFTRQELEPWRSGTRTLSAVAVTGTSVAHVRTSQGTARLWGASSPATRCRSSGSRPWSGAR